MLRLLSVAALMAVFAGSILSESTASAAEPGSSVYEMRTYYAPEESWTRCTPGSAITPSSCSRSTGFRTSATGCRWRIRTASWSTSSSIRAAKPARRRGRRSRPIRRGRRPRPRARRTESWSPRRSQLFLSLTDYSVPVELKKDPPRVFELRTYTASEGNLDHLHARFRDHTCKLFEKHGATNIAYWSPMADPARRPGHAHLHHRPQVPRRRQGVLRGLRQGPRSGRRPARPRKRRPADRSLFRWESSRCS